MYGGLCWKTEEILWKCSKHTRALVDRLWVALKQLKYWRIERIESIWIIEAMKQSFYVLLCFFCFFRLFFGTLAIRRNTRKLYVEICKVHVCILRSHKIHKFCYIAIRDESLTLMCLLWNHNIFRDMQGEGGERVNFYLQFVDQLYDFLIQNHNCTA